MSDKATHMEARLMGLSKRRSKDGDWFEIKLSVHPDDMPNEMFKVDLGTRLGVAMVQIGEDEQPVEKPKRRFSELKASEQAGILCQDQRFQLWCKADALRKGVNYFDMSGYEIAVDWVRDVCGVESRSEMNSGRAFSDWVNLRQRFEEDTHLPERH